MESNFDPYLKRVIKSIDESEIIKVLKDLVAIPSYNGLNNQEYLVAKYINDYFINNGIESKLILVEDGRFNVEAILYGKNNKNLMLTGHLDTVPPYNMEDPFNLREIDGNLYGRGAVDMKGALASMMVAMKTINDLKIELGGNIYFEGVIDEEHKSLGTIELLERIEKSGLKFSGAVVGEPSDGDICIGHRGLEWFEIVFIGKAVHGGKQHEGVNAIEFARLFMNELDKELIPKLKQRKHKHLGNSTINYGVISGGTQPSTVAGECIIKLDRRWLPNESFISVKEELEQILNELEKNHPDFKASLRVMDESVMSNCKYHEHMEIDENHELVRFAIKSYEYAIEEKINLNSFSGWTDAGLISTYGEIPTIVYGPGSIKSAHSDHEHVEKKSLLDAAKFYAALSINYLKEVNKC
jgi:acetylornithine deacetylase/succinyl-diaminopimelate desuccinylase